MDKSHKSNGNNHSKSPNHNSHKPENMSEKAKDALHSVEKKTGEVVHEAGVKINEVAKEAQKIYGQVVNKENVKVTQDVFTKVIAWLKENVHLILAAVFVFIWIFILREYIIRFLEIAIGIACLLAAYLLATDFFKKDKKDKKHQ